METNFPLAPNNEEILKRAKDWEARLAKYTASAEFEDEEGIDMDDLVAMYEAEESDYEEEYTEEENSDTSIEIDLENDCIVDKEHMELDSNERKKQKELALIPVSEIKNSYNKLVEVFEPEFIDACQREFQKRFIEVSRMNLPFWNYSHSFEQYNENHIQTPTVSSMSRNFTREHKHMKGGMPAHFSHSPDPRQDLRLYHNNPINGLPMQNGSFSFVQPVSLPGIPHFLPQATGQRLNLQVREFRYNLSFDSTQDISNFLQSSMRVNNENNLMPMPNNNSYFPGQFDFTTVPFDGSLNFMPQTNSTFVPQNNIKHKEIKQQENSKNKKVRPLLQLPPPSPLKKTKKTNQNETEKASKNQEQNPTSSKYKEEKSANVTKQVKTHNENKIGKESNVLSDKIKVDRNESKKLTKSEQIKSNKSNETKESLPTSSKYCKEKEKVSNKLPQASKEKKIDVNAEKSKNNERANVLLKKEKIKDHEIVNKTKQKSSIERETLHDRPLRRDLMLKNKFEKSYEAKENQQSNMTIQEKPSKNNQKQDDSNKLKSSESNIKEKIKSKNSVFVRASSSSSDEFDFVKYREKNIRKKKSNEKKDISAVQKAQTVPCDLVLKNKCENNIDSKEKTQSSAKISKKPSKNNRQMSQKPNQSKLPESNSKQENKIKNLKKPSVRLSSSSSSSDEFDFVKYSQQNKEKSDEKKETKILTLDDISCGSSCSTVTSDDDFKFFQNARYKKMSDEKKLKHRQQKLKKKLQELSIDIIFNNEDKNAVSTVEKNLTEAKVSVQEDSSSCETDDDFFANAVKRANQQS